MGEYKKDDVSLNHRLSMAGEGSSRGVYASIADVVGMPVDLINGGLKLLGVKTSDEPLLGSKHLNKHIQAGLDWYYDTFAPSIGYKSPQIQDDLDRDILFYTYNGGRLAGFGGVAKAGASISTKLGGAILTGGTIQFGEDISLVTKSWASDAFSDSKLDITENIVMPTETSPKPQGNNPKQEQVKLDMTKLSL